MAPPRRKVRDAAHARQLLAELGRSTLTLAEFARARGIDGRSLNMHRVNLSEPDAPDLRLVELVPEPRRPVASDSGCRLRYGDIAIEVDAQFDEDVLRRVLAVIGQC